VARNDLIEAYQNGRISRRAFVRGMMALGVSASVAVSLADGVRAAPGARKVAVQRDDAYEDTYSSGGGTTTLPSTGAGISGSGDSWVKPLAVLGAGAALVAGGLRRLKGDPTTAE
jgi:hypothetical protein